MGSVKRWEASDCYSCGRWCHTYNIQLFYLYIVYDRYLCDFEQVRGTRIRIESTCICSTSKSRTDWKEQEQFRFTMLPRVQVGRRRDGGPGKPPGNTSRRHHTSSAHRCHTRTGVCSCDTVLHSVTQCDTHTRTHCVVRGGHFPRTRAPHSL